MEGMNAFLEKRKPDFQKFREMNKENVENYLDGIDNNENERPVK
jgi:naphthoate synthase